MADIINRHTSIKEVHEIMNRNGFPPTKYSDIVLMLMVMNCDHVEVRGFGHNAELVMVQEEENNE